MKSLKRKISTVSLLTIVCSSAIAACWQTTDWHFCPAHTGDCIGSCDDSHELACPPYLIPIMGTIADSTCYKGTQITDSTDPCGSPTYSSDTSCTINVHVNTWLGCGYQPQWATQNTQVTGTCDDIHADGTICDPLSCPIMEASSPGQDGGQTLALVTPVK
jgi:hypothetical protein